MIHGGGVTWHDAQMCIMHNTFIIYIHRYIVIYIILNK